MKNKRKIIFLSLIISAVVVTVALFIANLVVAGTSGDSANMYTALSGWTGGVATIILGTIALVQNIIYKNTNEKAMILQDSSSRWHQLECVMEKIYCTVDTDEFLSVGLEYVHNLDSWKGQAAYEKVKANIRYKQMYYNKATNLAHLCRKINMDGLYFESKNGLCVSLDNAMEVMFDVGDFYSNNDIKNADEVMMKISSFSDKLSSISNNVANASRDYLFEYKAFIEKMKFKNAATINKEMRQKKDREKQRKAAFKSRLTKCKQEPASS